ncbi:MAG: EAL domain-containing protein [Pseudomonadota bacterium]|nr:EAL domain-containing protein [Pseudomonadota bacterium]
MPYRKSRQRTILIVDDTPNNLVVMVDYLGTHGFSLVVAQDGPEAIERALFAHPDLILLDVMMPGMNGFDTCRQLKKQHDTAHIPVIFMTALSDPIDKMRGFDAGGVDYITKPFQLDEVLARVNTHLALQEMQRQLTAQNRALRQEAAVRREAEAALQRAHDELEERVAQRTAELAQANARLTGEIFERGRMQEAVQEREARIRRLVESNIIGIFFWSSSGYITEANDAFLGITGYQHQDLLAQQVSWSKMTPVEYSAADERALAELRETGTCTPFEKEFISKDGRRIPILIGAAFFDGSRETGVGFVLDLSARKEAEERIRFMAHHDSLTGLPNRALLQDRMIQAIGGAQRLARQLGLLVIDLDDFKRINDSLGHEVGDHLLQMVANRLRAGLRIGDSIARLGGDEFVITVSPLVDANDAALVARKTLDALTEPFTVGGHEFHVSASIGISLYPVDGTDVDTLMRAADTAMYHAKESGGSNFQFFTPALNKAVHQRLIMENRLRHALAEDQFTLHYQPQVDMESGAIFSSEALLRWDSAGEKAVSCGNCIATAEKTGLIVPIGEWTLRQACKQLKRWHDLGYSQLQVAVNLSPRQFYQRNLPTILAHHLEEAGIAACDLVLEITEGILLQRNNENISMLKELSAMGMQLSVDDFGTGYSSLAYLQRYPINSLKIDQSFVGAIAQDASARALVNAIIAMAHSLGLSILAEGVETQQQAAFLMEHGCTLAQGYYYSPAVPPDAFTALLGSSGKSLMAH